MGKLLEIERSLDPPDSNLIPHSLNNFKESSLRRPDFCTAILILFMLMVIIDKN